MTNHLEPRRRAFGLVDALLAAMDSALRDSNPTDVWRYSSYAIFARKYNDVLDTVLELVEVGAPVNRYDLEKMPGPPSTMAMHQKELFESVRVNLQLLRADISSGLEPNAERAIEIADFLQANTRRAVLSLPERERDLQDVVEQLLIGRGLQKGSEYDRETGRVKVSTKEVIPDFVMMPISLAIEVKFVKEAGQVSRIVDEINADIQSYGRRYETLIFLVYDVGGAIRDEVEFRHDLEQIESVRIVLVKH